MSIFILLKKFSIFSISRPIIKMTIKNFYLTVIQKNGFIKIYNLKLVPVEKYKFMSIWTSKSFY